MSCVLVRGLYTQHKVKPVVMHNYKFRHKHIADVYSTCQIFPTDLHVVDFLPGNFCYLYEAMFTYSVDNAWPIITKMNAFPHMADSLDLCNNLLVSS